jgi:hypothetical protein
MVIFLSAPFLDPNRKENGIRPFKTALDPEGGRGTEAVKAPENLRVFLPAAGERPVRIALL